MAETILGLRARLRDALGQFERRPWRVPALMGDADGNVEVSNRPGYVYVRNTDGSPLGQALNQTVQNRANLPIIVGYTALNPSLLQVLGQREVYPGTDLYQTFLQGVQTHHETHEFGNAAGGGDVVWVRQQQIVPFVVAPTDPASMQVKVRSGVYYRPPEGLQWFDAATSADLTTYLPASGNAVYLLISMDVATGELAYTSGDEFGELAAVELDDGAPAIPGGHEPLAMVRLISTTTSVTWDELNEVRRIVTDPGTDIAHAVGALEAEIDRRIDSLLTVEIPRLISHAVGALEAEIDLWITQHALRGEG